MTGMAALTTEMSSTTRICAVSARIITAQGRRCCGSVSEAFVGAVAERCGAWDIWASIGRVIGLGIGAGSLGERGEPDGGGEGAVLEEHLGAALRDARSLLPEGLGQ